MYTSLGVKKVNLRSTCKFSKYFGFKSVNLIWWGVEIMFCLHLNGRAVKVLSSDSPQTHC